ncbi:MAG: hypothetical protein IJB80_07210 [Clostridia bacterium]|nr:hypothetical protein [Clostridia bacterium]
MKTIKSLTEAFFSDRETFVEQFAENIQMDESGNFFWEKDGTLDMGMLLFVATPAGIRIKQENGDVLLLGDAKGEKLLDSVCVSQKGAIGILRMEAEKLHLEPFETIEPGVDCYLQPETNWKGDKLYGAQTATGVLLSYAVNAIRYLTQTEYRVKVAFVNETACGTEKSLEQIYRHEPKQLLVCAAASVDGNFAAGKGAGVLKKDGGCVIAQSVMEQISALAEEEGISVQPFLGSTGQTLSKLYPALKSNKFAGIYLPVKEKGSRCELMDAKDVEKTQKLLLKCLQSFDIIFK